MPGSTPNRGYPFPLGTEPPKGGSSDGPGNIEALAVAVEADIINLVQVLSAPPGMMSAFAGTTAPSGWLICDGSAVSRATYAALFTVVGVTYGIGDGSTTFNIPNLKGRVPVGLDTGQTEFDALGKTGGAKVHSHMHISPVGRVAGGPVMIDPAAAELDAGGSRYEYLSTNAVSMSGSGATGYSVERYQVTSGDAVGLSPYITLNYLIKT